VFFHSPMEMFHCLTQVGLQAGVLPFGVGVDVRHAPQGSKEQPQLLPARLRNEQVGPPTDFWVAIVQEGEQVAGFGQLDQTVVGRLPDGVVGMGQQQNENGD
jgi:hypothetical protein